MFKFACIDTSSDAHRKFVAVGLAVVPVLPITIVRDMGDVDAKTVAALHALPPSDTVLVPLRVIVSATTSPLQSDVSNAP